MTITKEYLADLDEVEQARFEALAKQFSPGNRAKITAANLESIRVGDVLRYNEDHGYSGSWDEIGVVEKITNGSIIARKETGKTSRISTDPTKLRRRMVYRLGTLAEMDELRLLRRRHNAQHDRQREDDRIAKEREMLKVRIYNIAVRELVEQMDQNEIRDRELNVATRFADCPKCGWPGREQGQGCLRCSDGF